VEAEVGGGGGGWRKWKCQKKEGWEIYENLGEFMSG